MNLNLELIKKLRIEKGYSVEKMSMLLGYESYQAYYRKENGQRLFTANDVKVISNLLEEPMEKFFR